MLIDAFGKVQKEHRDVSLVFVGKEDYFYKRLKDRVKSLKLNAKIRFYGYATDEELGALYEKAMALVCPSKMEGFGLPMLEAMARECLVVASDIPVFKEIGKEIPVYFDPSNKNDLFSKLLSVLEHSNDTYYYSEKINKGLERVKQFSWKKMAQETLAVYNATA